MSFSEKQLRITIVLNSKEKNFNANDDNALIIQGLRSSAMVMSGGGVATPTAKITIYGLNAEVMDRLTRLKFNINEVQNHIQVEAGEDDKFSLVFVGVITFAMPNFGGAPDVSMAIDAVAGIQHQLIPVPPVSFNGNVDVAQAIEKICNTMGMGFENSGVTAQLSNPYLPQTALEQIGKLCEAANVNYIVEFNKVAIWPNGKAREITVPVISPETGLISYPVPTMTGIKFRCLFDPAIRFGGKVEVRGSQVSIANGLWAIFGLKYDLDCITPNGKWFCEVQAAHVGEFKVAKQ